MAKDTRLIEPPPMAPRPSWIVVFLAVITALWELVHRLRTENQALRDEVARLKRQKTKPVIAPSKLNDHPRKPRKGRCRPIERTPRPVDRTEVVKPAQVPPGSRFKGYADYTVQELVIRTETVLYRVERWQTPDGTLLQGTLPVALADCGPGDHYGPTLRSFILYQYYHAQVTEPLLLEQLREWGVQMSSGELHALLTAGKDLFHQEKDAILRVGLRVSGHVHTDDTGARHQGQNGVTTHIGNPWFAWFETTTSKSRINFLELLRAGHTDYVLSEEALEYMAAQHLPVKLCDLLAPATGQVFANAAAWQAALVQWKITDERHVRIATEGALLGAVRAHGIHPDLAIVSDDAGQFNVLLHALCWIHAERVLARLVGFNDAQRADLDAVRTTLWQLYRDLQAYRAAPTEAAKPTLTARFDALCATRTCFASLNQALRRMQRNKPELLLVLERPDLPLHNNLSEGDIREYVKRRKISGGTRSEAGRRARDTFASLKKTCRKLGVSFWAFLNDRVRAAGQIPSLPSLIEARAQGP